MRAASRATAASSIARRVTTSVARTYGRIRAFAGVRLEDERRRAGARARPRARSSRSSAGVGRTPDHVDERGSERRSRDARGRGSPTVADERLVAALAPAPRESSAASGRRPGDEQRPQAGLGAALLRAGCRARRARRRAERRVSASSARCQPAAGVDRLQHADHRERRDHRAAAVADERQRDPRDRRDADGHPDVEEHLEQQARRRSRRRPSPRTGCSADGDDLACRARSTIA